MSMLTMTAPVALDRSLCPGAYLTDGIRLYRVVTVVFDPWKGSESAELEDCHSLKSALHSPDALERMCLELVRPAPQAPVANAR